MHSIQAQKPDQSTKNQLSPHSDGTAVADSFKTKGFTVKPREQRSPAPKLDCKR